MSRIYLDEPIDEQYLGAIVALGNFDGVHLGHQAVIGEAVRWARSIACPCVVATFDPHPVRYFSPDADPFHLTTLDQRQELLEALGADAMLIFRFNEQLATIHADRWVERVIAHRLAARGVVTGEDFNFGKARSGNAAMLKALGGRFGISARTVAAVHESGLPVSSSRIRQAIQDGDCTTATRLLTRPYAIRGRTNPSNNSTSHQAIAIQKIELSNYQRLLAGQYSISAVVGNRRIYQGIADFNPLPTLPTSHDEIELFLHDFPESALGEEIEVRFHTHLETSDLLGGRSTRMK